MNDDSFWKPYRESTKRYMPAITSVRWVRHFQLAAYRILVGTDCDSSGTITYLHVLYVYRENDEAPWLAVASEHVYKLISTTPYLCMFFGRTHFNMGPSPDWADLTKFTDRALKEIIAPLGISDDEMPNELPLD